MRTFLLSAAMASFAFAEMFLTAGAAFGVRRMAGHVDVGGPAIASRRGMPGAAAGNGTGSPWWPLMPGTCIDYDVYPTINSWDNATNAMTVTSRGAKSPVSQRICAYTHDCPSCGQHGLPLEEYQQPPGTARGFLTEGISVDAQGVASVGESGNNGATYTQAFLGKIPIGAGSPRVGQYVHDVTQALPQSVCTTPSAGACVPPAGTFGDYWTLRVISMGKFGPWADTTHTGLLESIYGKYNYVFAKGKGMVNFWYYGINTMTPAKFHGCVQDCPGFEYYAIAYPTDKSPAIGAPPFWAEYP